MSKTTIKDILKDCCNDIVFSYNDKPSGITSTVKDYKPTYQVWHGEDTKEYDDIDILMADKFYSGKSLNDLADAIEFDIV